MTIDALDDLITDTLYARRMNRNETCFVSNAAGLELLRAGPEVLPRIERILREVVAPVSPLSRPVPGQPDFFRTNVQFLGLEYVLGAFMFIGSRVDPKAMVEAIKAYPAELQAEFAWAVPIWLSTDGDRPRPPEELLSYLEEAAQAEDEHLRTNAQRSLRRLRQASSAPRHPKAGE